MYKLSWLIFLPVLVGLAIGCRHDDHNEPKTKAQPKDVAQNNPPAPQPAPPNNEEPFKFSKKGGGNIVSNIRGAAYRTERQSELKQIGIVFNQFCDDYKGANRTLENFLTSIKTFGPIHDAVKDGYYQMNMRAKLTANDIIAYERDIDRTGYLCVMGDGSVRYVPEAEWKAALGK